MSEVRAVQKTEMPEINAQAAIVVTQHGDPHVGILPCERIDHGHGHGHVSHGRESHYEYVLCPHLLFLAYNTGFVAWSLYIFICL